MLLAAHGVSHAGRRTSNEDALLVDLPRRLFVVADGMGGHNAGEVASELAILTIGEVMATETQEVEERLGTAVELANERIFDAARRQPDCAGMGTTVSAACILERRLLYANVGDSRIYRLHDAKLTQLTRDDSWIAHALATGLPLTPSDIEVHPMRHVLTEVVGVRTDMSVEVHEAQLEPGDILLLCSDGLHGVMPDEVLTGALAATGDVAAVAQSLVDTAMARGASDNVTVIVIRCS